MPARGKRFAAPVHSRRGPGRPVGAGGALTNRKTLNAMVRTLRRYGGPVHMDGKGFMPNPRAVALVRRWYRYPQHVSILRAEHVERGYCLAVVRGRLVAAGELIAPGLVALPDDRALVALAYAPETGRAPRRDRDEPTGRARHGGTETNRRARGS